MKKLAVVVAVIIALLVAALAYLVVARGIPLGMIPLLWQSQPKEHSARYYPDDTMAYFWMTLNPSDGQRADMLELWERFNEMEGFADAHAKLEATIYGDTGIRLEEDVLSWIGTEVSAGILSATPADYYGGFEEFEAAATIQVRDFDAAEIFMRKFLEFREGETDAQFDSDTLGDFKIWIADADGDTQSYALSKEVLIVATTESTLLNIIRRIDADDGRSLASSESFMEAREALQDRRFSSAYVGFQGIEQILNASFTRSIYGYGHDEEDFCPAFGSTTNWIAVSAAWERKAVTWEIIAPSSEDFRTETRSVADAAPLLPADTLAFMAFSFEPDMDEWRKALDECKLVDTQLFSDEYAIRDFNDSMSALYYLGLDNVDFDNVPQITANSTLSDLLDLGLWLVDEQTGIHLEEDFTDYLSGDMVMSVSDFSSFDAVAEGDTVDAVMMLSYQRDNEQALSESMKDMFEFVNTYIESEARQSDVGADTPAELLGHPDFQYAPGGYVLHNGYLTLGSNESAIEKVVSRQNGEGNALDSVALYTRVDERLFQNPKGVLFIDAHRLIAKFQPSDLEIKSDEYEMLKESIGAVGVTTHQDANYERANLVLTLFPEDGD